MIKLQVITLICVLSFLQVFSEEASQPKFSCTSLCEQVDFGFAGICCGRINIKREREKNKLFKIVTGHDYCDCDSGSDIPLACPADEVFCDAIGT